MCRWPHLRCFADIYNGCTTGFNANGSKLVLHIEINHACRSFAFTALTCYFRVDFNDTVIWMIIPSIVMSKALHGVPKSADIAFWLHIVSGYNECCKIATCLGWLWLNESLMIGMIRPNADNVVSGCASKEYSGNDIHGSCSNRNERSGWGCCWQSSF